MTLRQDILNEKVELNKIVKRSALAKHINESILRPILDQVEKEARSILDDLGFMIVSEIQHRLATAPPGFTYEVWEVHEGAPRGQKYSFIGHYTASAEGGPPMSGGQTESGIPTGSLYESFWYDVNSDGVLVLTIDSPQKTEKVWKVILNDEGKMVSNKIFVGFDEEPLPVGEYFKILERETRPNWLRNILRNKRDYWNDYMNKRFSKAVKAATRRYTVHRALKVNIYWESKPI